MDNTIIITHMENKQTAVDYLYNQFILLFIEYAEDKIDYEQFGQLMTLARNAAKNIEQTQIDRAYNDGIIETSPMLIEYYKLKYEQ
jgi:hypothetical protein